jgi:type IV pilus assembly protein PilM
LSTLFMLGDYRLLATVSTPQFKAAVGKAKEVSDKGSKFKKAYDEGKAAWTGKFDEGKALIVDPSNRAMWPAFLKTISGFFPDPVAEYKLNPDDPANQDTLEKLRVHIDKIWPVYRTDVKTEWFDVLDPNFKRLMHPYDMASPPDGAGWIVQIVGHHYNPYPSPEQFKLPMTDPKRVEFGPYGFITQKVLSKLNSPNLRLYGVTHVALAWMNSDKDWTSEKGSMTNNASTSMIPLLDRAAPTATEGAAGGGGMEAMMGGKGDMMKAMMGNRGAMMGGPGGSGGYGAMGGAGMMGGKGAMEGMMRGMMGGGMYGAGMNKAADAEAKKKLKTLTRTDFLIQFLWKPPAPDDLKVPEDPEKRKAKEDELTAKVKDFVDKMKEAEKTNSVVTIPSAEEIEKASKQKTTELESALTNAMKTIANSAPAAPGAAPAVPGAATPGAAPAAPGAAPAAVPKPQ